MRILFWAETFWPIIGGAEVLAGQLLRALRERGHECLVVAEQYPSHLAEREEYAGIPVHRLPFGRALGRVRRERNLDSLFKVRQRLATLKAAFAPELVHAFFFDRNVVYLRQTAMVHPAPMLATLHHVYDTCGEAKTSSQSTLRSADWVAACSAAVLDETRRRVPEIVPCSSVIRNTLAMPAVPPRPLPFDPPRLLCLGRAVGIKGFDVALAAFARLVDRYPRLQLVIAGDGAARAALARQAADLNLADAVDFRGWVDPDDIPALINTSTIVIVPSRWQEPFGLVALQAAQMARPVVATRVGGLPEVVIHEQTGVLVGPEDSAALAEAIAGLLDRPDRARRLGGAAHRRAQAEFGWERHVDAYEDLYRRLVGAGPRAATVVGR